MEPNNVALNDWWLKLKAALLADKRKTTVMFVLLTVGAVIAINAVTGGSAPAKAKAGAPAVSKANPTEPGPPRPTRRPRQNVSDLAKLNTDVSRDLFAIEYAAYPQTEQAHADKPQTVEPVPAEDADLRRQQHVSQIREQARLLGLQSVMPGDPPSAIINGQVVMTGQVLGGFTVSRIEPRSCVLIKEGVTVTLKME